MSFLPFTPRLCRQQGCAQGAGISGLCPEHLRGSLQRRSLAQLFDLLEVMLEPRPSASPEQAARIPETLDPLLN